MAAVTADSSASGFAYRVHLGRLCALLAVVAHAPLVAAHLTNLWDRPHYQFVGVLLPLIGWLMWQRRPRDEVYVPARLLERCLLVSSVAILSIGFWLNSPSLATASAILAIGFVIVHLAGVRSLATLLTPWLLLWFVVPPPLGFDLILIARMQSLTSRMTSLLLDLLAVDHLMAGNVLQVRGTSLFVDEACSGVHSLFSLLAFTAVFAILTSRGFLRSLLLLVCSIGWALMANVLRVGVIALAHVWWNTDLSSGWPHELLGLATFLIALGLVLSTDRWLHAFGHLFLCSLHAIRARWTIPHHRRRMASTAVVERHRAQLQFQKLTSPVASRSGTVRLAAITAYSLLIVADVSGLTPDRSGVWDRDPLESVSQEMLPQHVGNLKLVGFERIDREFSSNFGCRSCVWRYVGNDIGTIQVSLDASFTGWHELSRCYLGQGWTLQRRDVVSDDESSWVEAIFSRPTGEHACLVFSLVSLDGQPLTPTVGPGAFRLVDRLREVQSLQVQAFVESGGPIDEPLRRETRALFGTLRNAYRSKRRRTDLGGQKSRTQDTGVIDG